MAIRINWNTLGQRNSIISESFTHFNLGMQGVFQSFQEIAGSKDSVIFE